MANNCFYTMMAVSKNRNALERLLKIMRYKDIEYYLYRVFNADDDKIRESNGYYYVSINGDVAWSCANWFDTKEDLDSLAGTGAPL